MTESGYAKIERGDSDISINRLAQIAAVLEVDLSILFSLEDKEHQLVTLRHRLHQINKNQELTPDEIGKIKHLTDMLIDRLSSILNHHKHSCFFIFYNIILIINILAI
jgi:transcriptional regulator with XRE-family HTH domain